MKTTKRKTKYVYKLLRSEMKSAFMTQTPSLSLRYKLGVKRVPKIGKLFAFDTEANSRNYAPGMEVFKCEATGVRKLRRHMLDAHSHLRHYKSWWNGVPARIADAPCAQRPPFGTVICDSVTPIEQLP